MSDLLERMKKNGKPLGLLDEDEKQCLKDNRKHIEIYTYPKWEGIREPNFNSFNTPYRIDPNYNPEPEIPVLEGYRLEKVSIAKCGLLCFNNDDKDVFITQAPNKPNFAGYGYMVKNKVRVEDSPVRWLDENGDIVSCWRKDRNPIRPDYVVFKETK